MEMEGTGAVPEVRVRGVLRGMNREADCVLVAWKESSESGRVYTRCRIIDEPSDLPDGTYTVIFAGQSVTTRKWWGEWMLTFLPPEINVEP
jgi:hypothetical protein